MENRGIQFLPLIVDWLHDVTLAPRYDLAIYIFVYSEIRIFIYTLNSQPSF